MGILGLGAFGRLMAAHLVPHARLLGFDPRFGDGQAAPPGVAVARLAEVAACDIVVLAVPVDRLEAVILAVRPHLRPGALVVDVVRHDAPEVFPAIERDNPHAHAVRRRFFALATELDATLDAPAEARRTARDCV